MLKLFQIAVMALPLLLISAGWAWFNGAFDSFDSSLAVRAAGFAMTTPPQRLSDAGDTPPPPVQPAQVVGAVPSQPTAIPDPAVDVAGVQVAGDSDEGRSADSVHGSTPAVRQDVETWPSLRVAAPPAPATAEEGADPAAARTVTRAPAATEVAKDDGASRAFPASALRSAAPRGVATPEEAPPPTATARPARNVAPAPPSDRQPSPTATRPAPTQAAASPTPTSKPKPHDEKRNADKRKKERH